MRVEVDVKEDSALGLDRCIRGERKERESVWIVSERELRGGRRRSRSMSFAYLSVQERAIERSSREGIGNFDTCDSVKELGSILATDADNAPMRDGRGRREDGSRGGGRKGGRVGASWLGREGSDGNNRRS